MTGTGSKRLVLIDGHGLAYRMYYAISQGLTTRSGEPTNATMGFTRTLVNLITDEQPPDYLAVSFDVGSTFRDEMFEGYKATREKMPEDLQRQIARIHEVLDAFSIPVLEVEGYEADDVLGTVARLAEEMGVETVIITGDKDLLQLARERTTIQLPGRTAGEVQNYGPADVLERFGVRPEQFVDFKALIGDKSDNIPGVPGIGEKTAARLLQEYGSLDGIYEKLESVTPRRIGEILAAHREDAYLSRELSRIITEVPLTFDLEACRTHEFDGEKVAAIFQELEFRSLLKQLRIGLDESAGSTPPAAPAPGQQLSLFGSMEPPAPTAVRVESPTLTHIITDEAALDALVEKLRAAPAIAFDTETTSTDQMRAQLVGISLAITPGEAYYIPVAHQIGGTPQLPLGLILEKLRPPLTDPAIAKLGHNIKYDAIVLARHGLDVSPLSFDTMIGEALLRAGDAPGKVGLKSMAFSRLGIEMTEIEELIGSGQKQITFDLVPVEYAAPYAAADADITLRLAEEVRRDLTAQGLDRLFDEIEMPLVPVVMAMERRGVLVDVEALHRMSAELGETLEALAQQAYTIAGTTFNLNSSQQLSAVLFEDLKLPTQGIRKTSGGRYSTAADVLESLRDQDPTGIIDTILQYRELEKLRSTYLDALPGMVNPETGRIHSSFNQVGTSTGRLSSSDPNLQNIPIRSEQGRRVRDAFIAAPGYLLVGADYSQVELRILAHMSGDEALRQAFLEGLDIHASTAAAVNNVPIEQVTPAQRSFAKAVNFGLLYGMGAFRLARDSDLTLAEAEAFINAYFERFPRVRGYLDSTRQQAAERGYVETLLGRRRYFPILQSHDTGQQAMIRRRAAEREAVNMPIQGTAADIIKIAMLKLHQELLRRGSGAYMILQIHDELIFEVPEGEAAATADLIREIMETAYPLDVPLKVDVHTGQHWGELK
ncbi:MAG: DNA polymerase I [Anaerolineae bacterium]